MNIKLIRIVSLGVLLSGCVVTTTTQLVEKERVDQSLSGNQGYLVGNPPETEKVQRKETRQLIQVDIELPTLAELQQKSRAPDDAINGNRGYLTGREGDRTSWSPAMISAEDEMAVREASTEERSKQAIMEYTEYQVRKGDTLQSIAANPEIYGNPAQWLEIYEANRDQLKNPDKIYPGQKLRIPRP